MPKRQVKRWHQGDQAFVEESTKVRAFMDDLDAVFVKHQLILGHEDEYGAFIIEKLSNTNRVWIEDAHLSKEVK